MNMYFLIVIMPLIAMFFSFISLLKTSYDFQDVSRINHSLSSPRYDSQKFIYTYQYLLNKTFKE